MRADRRDALSLLAALALVATCGSVLLAGIGGGGVAPPDGFITGCRISFSGDNTVLVAPGVVRDADDITTITVASTITLTTADQAYSAGTGGGLDTGVTRAANTWYYAHLANSSTVGILLSTSRTAPTLPAGVTNTRWIGACRADAAADWLQCDSYGDAARMMNYVREDPNVAPLRVLNNGSATAFTNLDVSAVVPPEADDVWLWIHSGASGWMLVTSAGFPGVNHERVVNWDANATTADAHGIMISVSRLQSFKYRMFAGSTGHVNVQGYSISCDGTE